MGRMLWCLTLALLAGSGRLRAQTLQDPGLLAYARDVLARSPSRQAAASRQAAGAAAIPPAGALPDPMLTIGAMSVPASSFDLDAEPMTQVPTIQLEQRFPFPGKQGARSAVARADWAVRVEMLGVRDAELALAATRAYYELAYARTALDVWRRRAELAAQAVQVSEARYATGAAPQTDALRARLRRAQLAAEGHAIEAAAAAARARADALRAGAGTPIATASLVTLPDPTREPLPADSALAAELERASPALRLARAEVVRADRQAHVVGIDWRPDVMVSMQYGSRLAGREPFLTGMLGLSVPLWAWRKQTPAAAAARLEAQAAEQDFRDALARERGELAAALAELRALAARVALTRAEILPLAEAASSSALQRYRVGGVEFTALLDTQDDLFRAQIELARLVADYGAVRARLAALLGEEWYR